MVLVALLSMLSFGCQDDLDDAIRPANALELNDFIWKAMNIFYLNKSEVPDLADNRFNTVEDYTTYLETFLTPEALFDNLITTNDRFSIIVSDFRKLEDALNGVRLDNGMRFGLVQLNNSNDVFGYVRYVLPNSPAANAGVERGMLFNKVNAVRLSEDTDFSSLFSGSNYSISLAELNESNLQDTNQEIALEKIQLTEQAIHKTEIFENSSSTVAYLMYNGFRSGQENQLNAVFGNFAAQGVNELVLDLRYNSGGDLRTSVDLASMITGQFASELFATQEYNANFENEIINFTTQNRNGGSLNSLNLSRVFILTSPSTASASEMVISGLLPYINVVQIGTSTVGKYQASTTLYDSDNYRRQNASLAHTYALQPLISKLKNANNYTDFDEGIPPSISLNEDFNNLGELGTTSEPLLKKALEEIGFVLDRPLVLENTISTNTHLILDDAFMDLDYQNMYIEFPSY
ncbi:peptidase S41 [Psychroflexus salis]|uniref:Peptidase S41 n=2 Tax=Psychroflexus salis TaxID=1526574 RepID=A0A916ZY79_9FLAO|nr:peptidase S41 [Psychroflexus salis]